MISRSLRFLAIILALVIGQMTYAKHDGSGHHGGDGHHTGNSSDGGHEGGHGELNRPDGADSHDSVDSDPDVRTADTIRTIDSSNRALTGLTSSTRSFKEATAKFDKVQSTGTLNADLPTIDPEAKNEMKTVLAHTTVVDKNATELLTSLNSLKSDVGVFQSLQQGDHSAALESAFSTFQTDLQGIKNEVQSMIQSGQITDQEIEKAISEATQKIASIKERVINNHSTDAPQTEPSATNFEALGKSFDDLSARIAANKISDKAAQTMLNKNLENVKQQVNSIQTVVAGLSSQSGSSRPSAADLSPALAVYSQRFADAAKNVRLAAQGLDQSMTDLQNSVDRLQKLSPSDDIEGLQGMAADIQDLHKSADKELKTLADAFDALASDFN